MTGHDDADPDDDGLKGLRSMWLSLPDEEPPSRGLDALMSAARVKAEEMAQPSLWERIVAMMRRPQVLALATIMILIGGAVFISQRRDKLEATHSASTPNSDNAAVERASEQAPAAQTISAPTGPTHPPAEEAEGGASVGSAMVGGATADKSDFKSQPAPSSAVPAPDPMLAEPQRPRAKSAVSKKAAPGGSKMPAKPKSEQQTKSGAASGATSGSLSLDDLDASSPKAAEEAKPVPPDSQASTVQQLYTQARAAAARGDCAAVKALAKKIAAKDAPYYRSNIAPNTALAACLN